MDYGDHDYQYRFLNYNKFTTLVRDVDNRGIFGGAGNI